jgi:hypothetical protein
MATHEGRASGAPVTDYDRISGGAAVGIVVDHLVAALRQAGVGDAGVGEPMIGRLGAELGGVEPDVVTAGAR